MHRARSGVALPPRRSVGADRSLNRSSGTVLILAAVAFAAAGHLTAEVSPAQLSAAEIEEASETGRRAALALLRGQRPAFEQALATDAIAARALQKNVWEGLSARQRELLRFSIRRRFVESLEPPPGADAEIAWSSARAQQESVHLDLGLRYPAGVLKTRWTLERSAQGWRVADVVLSDPGVSLAEEAGRAFGAGAIERRDRAREAMAAAIPRALLLAATLAIVFVFGRRLQPAARTVLRVAAAAPAVLFVIDGALAVRRALSEEYSLPEALAPAPWRSAERQALDALKRGRFEDARKAWARAVAVGAPAAPGDYQLGVALRAAGRTAEAREAFARALSGSRIAPGADRELGLLALAEGRSAEARDRLERYVAAVGPDPDSLSALAIARANLGAKQGALDALEQARNLVADGWKGLRLQAQVYARAGDAAKTVETLRAIGAEGGLDRDALRSDPAFLPIATDPIWVRFLAETPVPRK